MNTKLRKKAKIILKKIFCKLMKNVVFEKKNMGKVRKHRQACNNQPKKELFGIRTKLSYKNFFSENILATEMKKIYIHD